MEVFNLDSSKLNEILYNMENQTKDSVIVISTGEIIYADESQDFDQEGLYPLPKWGSVDGFRIMNEFVSNLKNPVVKEELKLVLNAGSGVFRKFKNCLKDSPEVEKLWYSFKKDEIKSKVLNWYNQIREYAGLEIFSDDDFEEEDLIDFDFTITKCEQEFYDTICLWDKLGFKELYSNYPKDVIEDIYLSKRDDLLNPSMIDSDLIYLAENPSGEKIGFIWASSFILGDNFSGLDLIQLYVVPEYRGLGIGKILINKILEDYKNLNYKELVVNCQGKNSWLISYLELEGYKLAFQELSFRL
ncbi:MAG: GNAT family N-acetyltransferase [Spirochaetales bacterium]|nr:GNAT family N-acetyltransferase [Spirochaetales bacterium]